MRFGAFFAGRAAVAVAMGSGLLLTACFSASALDTAELCRLSKLRTAAATGARLLRCEERFPGDATRPDRVRCLRRVRAIMNERLAMADQEAAAAGFLCPSTPESLGVQGLANWPFLVMAEVGDVGSQCARQRLAALRRYSKAVSNCRISLPDGDADDVFACSSRPRQALLDAWAQIPERAGDCGDAVVLADVLALRIRKQVDAAAESLRVRCGDGRVAGFEECDDGGTQGDDGCTEDCRLQQCARVDGDVVCEICASDAVIDEDTGKCRCPDGYDGEPGSCTDIDECADGGGGCPAERPCVNLAGTYACAIPCTAEALHEAIASCGAPTGAIAFDCKDQVISIPRNFEKDPRRVSCDDLVIDGADNGLTFEMDPLCWKVQLPQERCHTPLEPDGTCACPDVDTGAPFLILNGDRNIVRNLTVRGFFDGVRAEGSDNVVENVRFERMCDDAFGAIGSGTGNVFRDLQAFSGCDKCSESDGDLASTGEDPRVPDHYSAIFENVAFEGCLTPLRLSKGGRYRIRGVTMTPSQDPMFPCDGPRFSGMTDDETVVHMHDSVVAECRRGVRFGILVDGMLWNNVIRDNTIRGVRVAGDAKVSMWNNDIRGNGGDGSNEPGYGGVAVVGEGRVDLGGGSLEIDGREVRSPGGNALCANLGGDELPRDLDNLTDILVPAEHNWWCTPESPEPSIFGPADFQPFLEHAR